jgi:hypothetical protein
MPCDDIMEYIMWITNKLVRKIKVITQMLWYFSNQIRMGLEEVIGSLPLNY